MEKLAEQVAELVALVIGQRSEQLAGVLEVFGGARFEQLSPTLREGDQRPAAVIRVGASLSEPPNTVKSWLNTKTSLPLIAP